MLKGMFPHLEVMQVVQITLGEIRKVRQIMKVFAKLSLGCKRSQTKCKHAKISPLAVFL